MKFAASLSGALTATLLLLPTLVSAQLSGKVGPTTSIASKAAKKTCNVLDYGAKADKKTDLGPALSKAWTACKAGGVVVVPQGDYAMSTWQTLRGGSGWALQLDGTIYRTGTAGGHMIIVQGTDDFEFFSSTSQGAMQGYGYEFHAQNTYGPRLVRLVKVTNWSFHDIKLVDSPAFHIIIDNCFNGEMYNTIIRGGNRGGLDGVDVSGNNIWIHDVSVTNKDECITIKTPAKDMLIEQIYCNWSGGSAIGSLGEGTAIENIVYNNIYTWSSNQMMMIKSNGGSGYVRNCTFSNFIGHNNAYALNLNANWAQRALAAGNGVEYSNLKFSNWQGTIVSASRAPISFDCPSGQPCTDNTLSNLTFAPVSGTTMKYTCNNAYGAGYCLKTGSSGAYSSTSSVKVPTSGFDGPKMSGDLSAGLGLTVSIDIPAAIPTLFYPGLSPIKPLMSGGGSKPSSSASIMPISISSKVASSISPTTSVKPTTSSAVATSVKPTASSASAISVKPTSFATSTSSALLSYAAPISTAAATKCAQRYWQCGGAGWAGATCCESGSVCKILNSWYSQCTPSS